MENRDIIIVGQQAWDTEIGSNCKNIAIEFSKKNRVLYVNPPLDRISKYRWKADSKVQKRLNIIKGSEPGLVEIGHNLYNLYPDCLIESINWITSNLIFDLINKYNNQIFSRSILKAITSLDFSESILFNDNDIFRSFYLKDLLKPIISIYYSRDNMIATEYWKRHGLVLEPKLIAKSDLCVANSEYLKNYCKQFNPNSFYVGQGCDVEVEDVSKINNEAHEALRSINSPIIGYVGFLTAARLDINLLHYIAVSQPSWNIVLVGPEDEEFKKSDLHNLTNIHFLGAKNPQHLPKYIALFDVCINPQILNDLTVGNYPRKIDEYLMLGKPTVATKTESMEVFREHVSLASNETEFMHSIEALLNNTDDNLIQSRIEFASSHTWENSVQLIYDRIQRYLNINL
ncbi:MAG: glycosyltransferase family 1 protein [Sphingobacteriales bacterium]|nr:glycosyltransferase family 1 protein [Sphingobacteriales bacterium]